jgi:3-methyladenine DNA glycosylase AlkD
MVSFLILVLHFNQDLPMIYEQTKKLLSNFKKIRTADVDNIAEQYLKGGVDVTPLYSHIKESGSILRIYFYVSLKSIASFEKQIEFIEGHFQDFNDWWHVDMLPQLIRKNKAPSFDFVYDKAKEYVNHSLPFARRWGYVIFLAGFQKDPAQTKRILDLYHNDDEYYVQMAEAWLLADLAIFNPEEVLKFIAKKPLNYNIIGKGIQKMSDSFRISDEVKQKAKELRSLYK